MLTLKCSIVNQSSIFFRPKEQILWNPLPPQHMHGCACIMWYLMCGQDQYDRYQNKGVDALTDVIMTMQRLAVLCQSRQMF